VSCIDIAVEEGKIADLVLLGANPLEDIRNTRRIWAVLVRGKIAFYVDDGAAGTEENVTWAEVEFATFTN
jgi:hypothetical protein